MKRYILIIIFAIGFGLNLNAQYNSLSDGFFSSTYSEYRENKWVGNMPLLPRTHGSELDYDAEEVPIGSGLLILTGLGLGYATLRRKDS